MIFKKAVKKLISSIVIMVLALNSISFATGETIEYRVNTLQDIINLLQENGQIFKLYQNPIIIPPVFGDNSDKGEGTNQYAPEIIHYITASESETAPMMLFDDELMYHYSLSNHNKNDKNANSVILKTSGITHDEKCEDKQAIAIIDVTVNDLTDYTSIKNLYETGVENMEIPIEVYLDKNVTETVIHKFNKSFNGFRSDRVLYPGKNTADVIQDLSSLLGMKESYKPIEERTGSNLSTKSQINRVIIPNIQYTFECYGCGATGTVTVVNANDILTKNSGDYTTYLEYGTEGIGNYTSDETVVNSNFKYFNKEFKGLVDKHIFKTAKEFITFYPYIKMRYAHSNNHSFKDAYITSSNMSKIADNIVVNISSEPIKEETLQLDSQWITNSQGLTTLNKHGVSDKNSLIAGGSNVNIKAKNINNDKINSNNLCIESYITCIPSVYKPNFEQFTFTEATAISELTKFKNSVKNTLNNYFIEKFISEGIETSEDEFNKNAKVIDGYNALNEFGNNKLNRIDKKYYLDINNSDKNKNSKVNAAIENEQIDIYMAQVNTIGDILLYKNNKYQGCVYKSTFNDKYYQTLLKNVGEGQEWFLINANTRLIDNLVQALDSNLGNSGRYNGYKGWYNEAIDGILVVRQVLDVNITLNNDKFDIQDPALCGKLDNTYHLYDNSNINNIWRTMQYKLSDRPYRNGAYEGQFVIGTLANKTITFKHISNILKSKLFYIGNGTVEN